MTYVKGARKAIHILRAQWNRYTSDLGTTWTEGSTFCGLRTDEETRWRVVPKGDALCKTCVKRSGI